MNVNAEILIRLTDWGFEAAIVEPEKYTLESIATGAPLLLPVRYPEA